MNSINNQEISEESKAGNKMVEIRTEVKLFDYKILEELAKKEKMSVGDLVRKMIYKELSFLSLTIMQQKEIFNYWNSKDIIKHKDFARCRRHISSALKIYSVEEIKESIDNFAVVLKDERSYWNYKWDLVSFLLRGIDRFLTCNKPLDAFAKKFDPKAKSDTTPKYKELT